MRRGGSSAAGRAGEICGLAGGFGAQTGGQAIHLGARGVERAGIVDDRIAAGDLNGVRQLGGEAGAGIALGAGTLFGEASPGRMRARKRWIFSSLGAVTRTTRSKRRRHSGTVPQASASKISADSTKTMASRIARENLGHAAFLLGDHGRMDDAVQLRQTVRG